ncbi:GNAT family N-acetyltransferase [Chitinophaga solisilvae]|uniref:GNAT family N-acetyltransferase n=1 Tax=Chitinophaga solisilvae TaxID=1233460 RepID=UPI0013686780|nr:GNAT family N-acetyltransferase [Chitinophaga solisilvae]
MQGVSYQLQNNGRTFPSAGVETPLSECETLLADLKRNADEREQARIQGDPLLSQELNFQWEKGFQQIRSQIKTYRREFDLDEISSIFAISTTRIEDLNLHRIWLGGDLSDSCRQAIYQWELLNQHLRQQHQKSMQSYLWVWDEEQLLNSPHFIADSTAFPRDAVVGAYCFGPVKLWVRSLSVILKRERPHLWERLQLLYAGGYYVNLSDYTRFFILEKEGGIYIDADTIPHRYTALMLRFPEVPADTTLSCLNSFRDEDGFILASPGDPFMRDMRKHLEAHVAGIEKEMLQDAAHRETVERNFFNSFYEIWSTALTRRILDYSTFFDRYSILGPMEREELPIGIFGMRVLFEARLGNQLVPLTAGEQAHYDTVIQRLEQTGWSLPNALDLEKHISLLHHEERLRVVYFTQLRNTDDLFNYYSVNSKDPQLDKVNNLFARYMIARNTAQIRQGNFWYPQEDVPVEGRNASRRKKAQQVFWIKGNRAAEDDQIRLGKLLYSTGYYIDYYSYRNKPGYNFETLYRKQNVEPFLPQFELCYNADGEWIGAFRPEVLSAQESNEVSIKGDFHYRDEMREVEENYLRFLRLHQQEGDCAIHSVIIDPRFQGQGYFHAMLQHMLQTARQRQCRRLTLTVWENNPASRLYQHLGFVCQGGSDHLYPLFFDRLLFLTLDLKASGL